MIITIDTDEIEQMLREAFKAGNDTMRSICPCRTCQEVLDDYTAEVVRQLLAKHADVKESDDA